MSSSQALLVQDVQVQIVNDWGGEAFLTPLANAIEGARRSSIPVIFVEIDYGPEHRYIKEGLDVGAHPVARPKPGETVVKKRRASPFFETSLVDELRALGVDEIVVTGIATSGVVLSAVRDGWDRGLSVIVLEDACTDKDEELHRVLVERLFPRHGQVMRVDDWLASLE